MGFLCLPPYLWLRETVPPAVELLPAAPVFRDERLQGQPAHFADLIVRTENPAQSFPDLRGAVWAYTRDPVIACSSNRAS